MDGAEYEMSAACWIYTDSRMTTAALTVGEDVETLKLYNPYAPSPLVLPENGILLAGAWLKSWTWPSGIP